MNSFVVGPQSLRDSARAAEQVASGLRTLGLYAIEQISAALPATQSASTAPKLKDKWAASAKTLTGNIDAYADGLTAAAKRYDADDKAAAGDFN